MSYILPYSLLGLSGGITLSYATEKYIFVPVGVLTGIGYGMIRNNNIQRLDEQKSGLDGALSFGLKALTIYVLGPPILYLGAMTVVAITFR
jgi:hypothetical protein